MATGRATYKPNHKGFAEMLVSPKLRAALLAHAAKGKVFAEALAEEFRDTGEYASDFEIEDATVQFKGEPRAAAILRNTSGHAAAVEWGYQGRSGEPSTSAHRVLGRTAEFLGKPEE